MVVPAVESHLPGALGNSTCFELLMRHEFTLSRGRPYVLGKRSLGLLYGAGGIAMGEVTRLHRGRVGFRLGLQLCALQGEAT